MLIKNGLILTMDPNLSIIDGGDILIENGRIVAIGRTGTLDEPSLDSGNTLDATDRLVMPGLINVHSHSKSALSKMAGSGDRTNTIAALWYGIAHAMNRSPSEISVSALVNAAQMLKTGCTSVLDQFYEAGRVRVADLPEIEAAVEGYERAGMRASVAIDLFDRRPRQMLPQGQVEIPALATELFSRPMRSIGELMALYRDARSRWHGAAQGRIRIVPSTSLPSRCSDELLMKLHDLADEFNVPMTTHVLEHRKGILTANELWGKGEVEHLADIGFLSSKLLITHGVWVSDSDIRMLAERGVSLAHCPELNIKLGGGLAPVPKMLEAGMNVALGADSATNQIMFDVMKLTALVHRIEEVDPRKWITAQQVLQMATINGARALGLGAEIGSLEVGKRADIILLDLLSPWLCPMTDIASRLVYTENGSSVDKVLVDGEVVVDGGHLTRVDEKELMKEARSIGKALLERNRSLYELADQMSAILAPEIDSLAESSHSRGRGDTLEAKR